MQNSNRKILDTLTSRTKIYLALILVLLIVICIQNPRITLLAGLGYLMLLGYAYYTNQKRKSEISETLQDLTLTVDSAAKTTLINSPFPLIILENDGNIIWKSSKFSTEFANIDINTYINDISIDVKDVIEKSKEKTNKEDIIKLLKKEVKEGDVLLFKASNGMKFFDLATQFEKYI